MTLRAVLDWQNEDSTADLNSRFQALFTKGVITGGILTPIVGHLQVSLLPFTAMSYDGMLVTSDTSLILNIPLDQTNVIAIHAEHFVGDPATLEIVVMEISAFNNLVDVEYYVTIGTVTTHSPATQVAQTDISYSLRDMQDQRTRDKIRGQVNSIAELPADPNFNFYGDMYVVYSGIGYPPNIYAWDGINWDNLTGANAVATALGLHQGNYDTAIATGEDVYTIGRVHLSNYQKLAALGSYGYPGATNRYMTQLDPRIPTTDQSNALAGSDGSPSATNLYITQQYAVAAPTILTNASPVYSNIHLTLAPNGPVYVGKGPINSANNYFAVLDYTENRGYLNLGGLPVKVNAIYTSTSPNIILDTSSNPLIDSFGFYNGPNLYIEFDNSVDTPSRLVYGKKQYLGNIEHGFPILPTPNYEIISGTLLSTIANIKGRLFDETVPTNEQNINLRTDLDSISSYIGSVLETNVVASNADFIRLAPPAFNGLFNKNVGVNYTYSFKNSIQSQFLYDNTTGTVTYYNVAVNLGSVSVGDYFVDAAGNNFLVTATGVDIHSRPTVNIRDLTDINFPTFVSGATPESINTLPYACVDGSIIKIAPGVITFSNTSLATLAYNYTNGAVVYSGTYNLNSVQIGNLFRDGNGVFYSITGILLPNTLYITSIQTGVIPLTINTSVGSYLDGSTWVNSNPRNLLLSEMKLSFGNEFIPVKNLVRITDEFSQPDGQVAFGIVRSDNNFDPRIVFYGSWENYSNNIGETYVRNEDGFGRFLVTGYFNHVFLVMRRRAYTGTIQVYINGVADSLIDPSAASYVSDAVANLAGPKYQLVKLNSATMSDTLPSTLTGNLNIGSETFDVYGFVFVRTDLTALLESGRAFESAEIVRRGMVDNTVVIDSTPSQGRGGRLVYAVLDNAWERVINTLNDLDAVNPQGTWTGTTITITISGGKLALYNVNDAILVYSALQSKYCRITSIGTNTIGTDVSSFSAGVNVQLLHICSVGSPTPLPTQEQQIKRYILPNDFINHTPTDMELILQSNRFVVAPDGLTILSGQSILVTNTNVIGTKNAIQIQQASAGIICLNVLATRLDLLVVNNAVATIQIQVDGCPYSSTPYSVAANAHLMTVFSNARYQSHQVIITIVTGNFSIAEMMLFGPSMSEFTDFPNTVADLSQIARYQSSYGLKALAFTTPITYPYPVGTVFREASSNISYINPSSGSGSNWSVTTDYTKSLYGPYISSDRAGAYIEFYIFNTAFELQYITGPDHGYFNVFVDGVDLASQGTPINYTPSGYVDGYSATYPQNTTTGIIGGTVGAYGLTAGLHKITAQIATTRAKNPSSSGYNMAFVGFYEGNDNGLMTYGINTYGVYSSIVDLRKFNALDMTPLQTGVQVTELLSRAAKVNLNIGTTSIIVNLAQPYVDTDYTVAPCMINIVDNSPLYQPFLLTAQTSSSFTISWNVPIPNGNYGLHYYTRSYDLIT